jgi:hypothetical protein
MAVLVGHEVKVTTGRVLDMQSAGDLDSEGEYQVDPGKHAAIVDS